MRGGLVRHNCLLTPIELAGGGTIPLFRGPAEGNVLISYSGWSVQIVRAKTRWTAWVRATQNVDKERGYVRLARVRKSRQVESFQGVAKHLGGKVLDHKPAANNQA